MPLPRFARQTITVLRAPQIRDHGSLIRDWDNAESHDIPGCMVEPLSTDEDNEHREAVMSGYRVTAPKGADVLATDKIQLPDGDFEVDGEPARQPSATGRLDHTIIILQKWSG